MEITSPDTLRLDSLQQIMPLCNGGADGSLRAFVSGGTAPYTFNWDENQNTANPYIGVAAGAHTVDIADANGCTISSQSIILG